jgi:hypothetical protein
MIMVVSKEERSALARIAAYTKWAHADGVAGTQSARDAFLVSFESRVDPNNELSPHERARRAANLRRAHYQRLARRSAEVRANGKQAVR